MGFGKVISKFLFGEKVEFDPLSNGEMGTIIKILSDQKDFTWAKALINARYKKYGGQYTFEDVTDIGEGFCQCRFKINGFNYAYRFTRKVSLISMTDIESDISFSVATDDGNYVTDMIKRLNQNDKFHLSEVKGYTYFRHNELGLNISLLSKDFLNSSVYTWMIKMSVRDV